MSILVIAEHNNIEVKSSTLNTISAASKLGDEIEVLVLGSNIENISKEISKIVKFIEAAYTAIRVNKADWTDPYIIALINPKGEDL